MPDADWPWCRPLFQPGALAYQSGGAGAAGPDMRLSLPYAEPVVTAATFHSDGRPSAARKKPSNLEASTAPCCRPQLSHAPGAAAIGASGGEHNLRGFQWRVAAVPRPPLRQAISRRADSARELGMVRSGRLPAAKPFQMQTTLR